MNRVSKLFQVRKTLAAIVALTATTTFVAESAAAADSRPLAVVSFADYESLTRDMNVVCELIGQPQFGQFLNGFLSSVGVENLKGLDTTKPWGVSAFLHNGKPEVFAFASVTDFNALTEMLVSSPSGQVQPQRDGVFTVWTERGQFFLKQENGFAFLVQNPGQLGRLPKNPVAALGNLPQSYSLALQFNFQEVPDLFRQLAIAQVRAGVQQNLALGTGLSPQDEEIQTSIVESQIATIETLIRELDQITVGLKIDAEGNASSDVSITGIPNGRFAKQAAATAGERSLFSGFTVDDPSIEVQVTTSTGDDESIRQGLQGLELLRSQAFAAIDNDQELPDDVTRDQFKAAVGELISVLGGNVAVRHV